MPPSSLTVFLNRFTSASVNTVAALILSFSIGAQSAAAQQNGDQVVAEVGDQKLLLRDVARAFETLDPRYQQQGLQSVYPQLLELLIQQMAIVQLAEAENLAETPDAIAFLKESRARILHDLYVRNEAVKRISEEELRADYDGFLAQNPPRNQVRASHILVNTEQEARDIIGLIGAGRDFAELAQEFSTGPSGPGGGDLGFFSRGQMAPPFEQAAFGLEANQYTADPVQTQFGWHVIYVTEKRVEEAPSFEQLRPGLLNQRANRIAEQVKVDLTKDVQVQRFDLNGEPIGPLPQ